MKKSFFILFYLKLISFQADDNMLTKQPKNLGGSYY